MLVSVFQNEGMIDEAAARSAVEAELARWREAPGGVDVHVDTVTEHRRAWVVTYGSETFLRTRDWRDQLVGGTPYVVDKETGRARAYGSAQVEIFNGWLDTATRRERRALFEHDAQALIGRRITGISYWDVHDFGQGPGVWDHGTWHHSVMGVGLDTDRGPVTVTWTSRFHPYGVEVLAREVESTLVRGEQGPQRVGPTGPTAWDGLLGQVCRAVHVTWWTLEIGPSRLSDGTVVDEARTVEVPVAARLDFDPGSVWFVAAIPQPPSTVEKGAFVGGDEIMVLFHPAQAMALNLE